MKQMMIFEPDAGDDFIKASRKLLQMRRMIDDDLFLRFNGRTMRITKDSTMQSIEREYDDEIHTVCLWSAEKDGFIDWERIKKDCYEKYKPTKD